MATGRKPKPQFLDTTTASVLLGVMSHEAWRQADALPLSSRAVFVSGWLKAAAEMCAAELQSRAHIEAARLQTSALDRLTEAIKSSGFRLG